MALVEKDNQWGTIKNGTFKFDSNFVMTIKYHVKASTVNNSGYLVNLTRHCDGVTGTAWFRFKDTLNVQHLTLALNNSFAEQRLFNTMRKTKMVQHLCNLDKKLTARDKKNLVTFVGQQDDGSLVLAPDLVLDPQGKKIEQDDTIYIWIPEWPTSPPIELARSISLPVTLTHLKEYLQLVLQLHANNASQVVLALASMVACSSYQHIVQMTGHFNLPLLTGPAMSGKTLTATCCAFIFGCNRNQIVSRSTIAFLTEQFAISTLPFVWDDPSSLAEVQQVAVDVGNGAFRGRNGFHGSPKTACMVTANFDIGSDPKFYSRVFQIRFNKLERRKSPGDGAILEEASRQASSSLPLLCQLGQLNRAEIIEEMDGLDDSQDIRMLEGVAIPLAICRKMLKAVGMEDGMPDIEAYCNGTLHNQQPIRDLEMDGMKDLAESELCQWLTAVKASAEGNDAMRQCGTQLLAKTAVILSVVPGATRKLLKTHVEDVKGTFGKMARVPASAKTPSRCISIPYTEVVAAAIKENDAGGNVQDIPDAADYANDNRIETAEVQTTPDQEEDVGTDWSTYFRNVGNEDNISTDESDSSEENDSEKSDESSDDDADSSDIDESFKETEKRKASARNDESSDDDDDSSESDESFKKEAEKRKASARVDTSSDDDDDSSEIDESFKETEEKKASAKNDKSSDDDDDSSDIDESFKETEKRMASAKNVDKSDVSQSREQTTKTTASRRGVFIRLPETQKRGLRKTNLTTENKENKYRIGQAVQARWKSKLLAAEVIQKTTKGLQIMYKCDKKTRMVNWRDVAKVIKN